jgi:hypothetical protein
VVAFFKEQSVPAIFTVIIICIALHAFFLFTPPAIVSSPAEGLMYYLLSPLSKLPVPVLTGVYLLVVITQALRLNYALNNNRMFQKAPLTAALAYILFTALWPACNNITGALVANSMLIWLLFRIIKLHNVKQPKSLVYNIGLLSGGTVLLYYPAIGIIPLVFIALGITRVFRINEWLVMLLGIATPFYFWGCYLFLTDQLYTFKAIVGLFQWHGISGPVKIMSVAFGAAGLLLLAGIARWQASPILLIQVRKLWLIIFLMLVCTVPVVFVVKNAWPYALLLGCVPAAALAANAFLFPKGVASTILFWVTAAAIVYVNWAAM